jgi:outer membrane protein with beta-barrel domain
VKLFSTQQIRILVVAIGGFTIAALQAAEPGVGEVSGFGGIVSMGGSTHANAGGASGVNLGRFVHLFGEVSYMAKGTESYQVSNGATRTSVSVSGRLMNYGGGVQIRIPTGTRIEPYGLFGCGYGQMKRDLNAASGAANPIPDSAHNVYTAAGVGARVFLGAHWGIKPEFRYQKYYGINVSNDDPVHDRGRAIAATTGIFYQFGGR